MPHCEYPEEYTCPIYFLYLSIYLYCIVLRWPGMIWSTSPGIRSSSPSPPPVLAHSSSAGNIHTTATATATLESGPLPCHNIINYGTHLKNPSPPRTTIPCALVPGIRKG
uniref:Uncharacterized protein n=1 Tax=Physcomitrium patens TaxID=3218 RepID=A0A2K1KWP2_PHYPA|nr:hypothetical protein PHYPA_005212 [Physcomitrium patens]